MATGTDEHGLKIQQAARKAGLSEQEFTRQLSARFKVRFSSSFSRSSFSTSCCLVALGRSLALTGTLSPLTPSDCDPIN